MSKTKTLLSVLAFGIIAMGNTAAYSAGCPDTGAFPANGCDLPGTAAGSFPFFEQGIEAGFKNKKKGTKVKARFDSKGGVSQLVLAPDDVLNIDNTFLNFKAKIKDGVIKKGALRINGMLEGMSKSSRLMQAKLSGAWDVSADGMLVGFDLGSIKCHDQVNALVGGCGDSSVMYMSLADSINDAGKKFSTTGMALTSLDMPGPPSEIPVPAAAWLFASGLAGLIGVARRRKTSRQSD